MRVISPGDSFCVHDWEELIDPESGGWMRCKTCGRAIDCEDPDGDL